MLGVSAEDIEMRYDDPFPHFCCCSRSSQCSPLYCVDRKFHERTATSSPTWA
jgi:hypothetical protein